MSFDEFGKYTWCTDNAADSDVVVSTRVRLARNLKDYPFALRLDEASANELIAKIRAVPEMSAYSYTDFARLSPIYAAALAERHIVSPEFAKKTAPHGLLAKPEEGTYIMLCEEDHVRIQCVLAGLELEKAYEAAAAAESAMDRSLSFAYSDRFGYLTHCPTNLGTGLRASVMLFLPAIGAAGELRSLQNQLTKFGLTVRGMSGEGSNADGCLYQISNQVTLGISEEETVRKLSGIVDSIIKRERELRAALDGERLLRLRDGVRRSLGTLKYAELLETGELLELYSKVRLGAALGMVGDLSCEAMDRLLFSSMAASVTAESEKPSITPLERDTLRAKKARGAVENVRL